MVTETFIAGRGFLYKMDPRAKTLLLLALVLWFFLPVTMAGLASLVLALVLLSLSSTGGKATGKVFLSILPMVVFMVLFMPFARRDAPALLSVGSFMILSREGLVLTLVLIIRFTGIALACALILSTSRMHEIMLSLQWYHLPYKAALVITLAFTYVPFVSDSFQEIRDSHRLREAAGEGGGRRLKDMIPTLTSALVVSLRTIPFLAMSLEERGYGRANKRSRYHDLSSFRHPARDSLLALLPLALLFVLFRLR